MQRLASIVVAAAVLSTLAPTVGADHPQPLWPDSGSQQTITFDHKGGNEWWVEVKVTMNGPDPYPVSGVTARSEKGTWQTLTLRSWGNWAGSFHIPPGERVQFQAWAPGSMSDIYRVTSCFFTHPAGVEQCDPGATDPFSATFTPRPGNSYWEEVSVKSNRPVAGVIMIVDGVNEAKGYNMKRSSWGSWTASVFVEQGGAVYFYTYNNGEQAASGCYRWPTAEPKPCADYGGPGQPSAYQGRWDHKGGNEWWVQVEVGQVKPDRVQARDDGGSWTELTFRPNWGTPEGQWAASFHIEPGHKVQFRAMYQYYSDNFESCWFTHPQGFSPTGDQICKSDPVPA